MINKAAVNWQLSILARLCFFWLATGAALVDVLVTPWIREQPRLLIGAMVGLIAVVSGTLWVTDVLRGKVREIRDHD